MSCEPASSTHKNTDTRVIPAQEFQKEIAQPQAQLVDARTLEEYQQGHIEGAVHMDVLDQEKFVSQIQTLDTTRPVYVYCKSGGRSQTAASLLQDHGFDQVVELKGGYTAWQEQ